MNNSNEEGYKINYTCSICLENIVPPMKFGVLCKYNNINIYKQFKENFFFIEFINYYLIFIILLIITIIINK